MQEREKKKTIKQWKKQTYVSMSPYILLAGQAKWPLGFLRR
jgi:hypothetical protein